jgi:hypothetical protein
MSNFLLCSSIVWCIILVGSCEVPCYALLFVCSCHLVWDLGVSLTVVMDESTRDIIDSSCVGGRVLVRLTVVLLSYIRGVWHLGSFSNQRHFYGLSLYGRSSGCNCIQRWICVSMIRICKLLGWRVIFVWTLGSPMVSSCYWLLRCQICWWSWLLDIFLWAPLSSEKVRWCYWVLFWSFLLLVWVWVFWYQCLILWLGRGCSFRVVGLFRVEVWSILK